MARVVLLGLGLALLLYLASLALLFVVQRSLIYPAPRAPFPLQGSLPSFAEARLTTSDGLSLRALYRSARAGAPTLVFFHGNGDNMAGAEYATRLLGQAGFGLLLPEYRGYAGNPGSPSEEGLYRDGRAALDWLAARGVAPSATLLVGNSLGSGVATQLATERPVAGLALVSGFTSLPDVAARSMPFVPVRLLLRDRYENGAKLRGFDRPLLVLHGAADRLIPADHARQLAAASPRATLAIVPGAGHELAYLPEAQAAILRWVEETYGVSPSVSAT